MGHWAQVQLSGSNFYANKLYFTASDDSTSTYNVVTWDSGDKRLKTTGSYKTAGAASDPYGIDWFPYNGNVDIKLNTSTGPKFRLRTNLIYDALDNEYEIGSSSVGDGKGSMYFLTSGTAAGADTNDYTLRIRRESGENANGNIVAKGTGDTIFKFQTPTGADVNLAYKRLGDFTISDVIPGTINWANVANLETTSGTNNANLPNGTYTDSLVFFFADIYNNFDVQPDDILLGAKFLIRDRVDNGVAYVTWSFLDPDNFTHHDLRSYTVTNTSNAARYIPGGGSSLSAEFDKWGRTPQPGNNEVYVSDLINELGQNSIYIYLRQIQVSSGASTNYRIAGGSLCPRIALKIKSKEGEIRFVSSSGQPLLRIPTKEDAPGGGLRVGIRGVVFPSPNLVKCVISDDEFEWVYQIGSTKRVKNNIQNYTGPLLDNFDKIRPVTFNYTNRTDKSTFGGFIAEEIAEISPSSVIYGKNYEVVSGALDVKSIIDDTLVPHDIKDRDIIAASVAKLKELDEKLKYL